MTMYFEPQYSDFVVTDVAKLAMIDAGLTGLCFEPVVATGAAVRETRYWEVQVQGFASFMKPEFVRGVRICDKCGRVQYDTWGTFADFIDTRKWDGSDIFTVWPFPKLPVMSARFVDELKSRKMRGFHEHDAAEERGDGAMPQPPDVALTSEQQKRLAADDDYCMLVLDKLPRASL